MSIYDVSASALAAAQDKIRQYTGQQDLDTIDPLQHFSSLEKHLSGKAVHYGVKEAILSGKRLRFFDEIREDPPQLNCAEVGINLFLIFCALGKEKNVQLVRYTDPGLPVDHFGVVYSPSDDSPKSFLVDPYGGYFGEIELHEKGIEFLASSITLLDEQGVPIPKQDADRDWITKDKYYLFDKEGVLNYIAYSNASIGFFDYYCHGQVIDRVSIGSEVCKDYLFPLITYSVKTNENHMEILASFCDKSLDFYTFKRSYAVIRGKLQTKDTHILHSHFSWTNPVTPIYQECKENKELIPITKKKQEQVKRFVAYINGLDDQKIFPDDNIINHFFQQQNEQRNCLEDKIKSLEKQTSEKESARMEESPEETANIREKTIDEGMTSLQEMIKRVEENIDLNYLEIHSEEYLRESEGIANLLKHLSTLELKTQHHYAAQHYFVDSIEKEETIIQRPYGIFENEELAIAQLHDYTQLRFKAFQPHIEDFFSSDVVTALLEQFQEAVAAKQEIEKLFSS